MKKLYYITVFIFLTCVSCSDEISRVTYSAIISTNEYSVDIIHYHGNILGTSVAYDNPDKLIVNKEKGKIYYQEGETGTFLEQTFTNLEINYLESHLDSIFQNHNSDKIYKGCCMCGNIDYEISNGTSKILIKPNGVQEYAILKIKKELNLE